MSNTNLLTITAKNYPNAILLGNKQYDLTFQIVNNSTKSEQFQFHFTMEGVSGSVPKQFQKPIVMESAKPYALTIPITPTVNGSGKIILQANIYKEVKYKEKVWHIRDEVSKKRGKEALTKSFVKFKDLTKGSKKPPKFKNGKALDLESAAKEYEVVYSSSMEQFEKDEKLTDIAKRVFNADLNFAFEVLKMVQNQASIQELLADFIHAGLERDKDFVLSKLPIILDVKIKDSLLENIIPIILEKDLNLTIQLCKSINDRFIRDVCLRDVFFFSYLKQFNEAMELVSFVSDQKLQLGLYYEIIKILKNTNPPKADALFKSLTEKAIALHEMEILANLLVIFAHIHNPKYIVDVIDAFSPETKESVYRFVRKVLWREEEEEKIKIEEVPVISLYYGFNVMVRPTSVMQKISELNGTVSSNLINGKMNSVIGIINLFSFNFPIYPTIEQCYAEINAEKGKSFYYLIIPLKNADNASYETVQTIIKNIFVAHANEVPHKMYLFNLDFIPYLSKPTIIVEDDPEENIVMQSIVKRVFKKEDVSLIIDDGLFKDGRINTWIKSILPSSKFKLLNLVLTYDFLNNYKLFKKFMNEFVR